MNKKIVYALALITAVAALTASALVLRTRNVAERAEASVASAAARADTDAVASSMVAAPGRVEPVSEEFKIGAEIGGKLREVSVEEGDHVQRGQVIAVLENADFQARVASAEAQLSEREAELRRVVNGARGEERREALAAMRQAEAVMSNAQVEAERRRKLFRQGDIAREEADRAEREYRVAKARYEETGERHALINAVAREEDQARAEADVALARARLREARAMLEKTFVRAPLTGVVLHRHLKTGESVSPESADPAIVTVGDVTTLRVRADVDETDVGKVQTGQRAYVTADAYGERKFWGRVLRIGQVVGKKNVRTDEPTERVDTKILETLIELDAGQQLHPGLRVNTYIVTAEKPTLTADSSGNR